MLPRVRQIKIPKKFNRAPIMFILPAVIVSIIVIFFPLAYTVFQSFRNWDITSPVPARFIGFRNYIQLFTSERVLMAFLRT